MGVEGVVSQMVILLLLVFIGFGANKFGIMGGDFDRRLSTLVINLTCPCLILSSVMGEEFPDQELILPLVGVGLLTYAVLFVVCSQLPRLYVKGRNARGMHSFMLMFGNVGFIGYPVVASIFGDKAVFYASLLNVANTLTVFLCGVVFVLGPEAVGKHRFNWRVLLQPGLVASYLSIIIVMAGIDNIPTQITEPIRLTGGMTVPGALLIIGSSMAQIDRRHLVGSPAVFVTSFCRLLTVPVAVYFLFRIIGIDETVNQINTILIGMPVASFGTMFCLRYQRDETLMVQGTLLTTLFSVLTIPLLTMLFGV